MPTIKLSDEEMLAMAKKLNSLKGELDKKAMELSKVQDVFDENVIEEEWCPELRDVQKKIAEAGKDRLIDTKYELLHTADRVDHFGRSIMDFLAEFADLKDETYKALQLANADIGFRISQLEPDAKSDDADRYRKGGDHFQESFVTDGLEADDEDEKKSDVGTPSSDETLKEEDKKPESSDNDQGPHIMTKEEVAEFRRGE